MAEIPVRPPIHGNVAAQGCDTEKDHRREIEMIAAISINAKGH